MNKYNNIKVSESILRDFRKSSKRLINASPNQKNMASELVVNLLLAVALIGFIVYLKFRRQKPDDEFTKTYMDILNSDKYKVKGRFEQ